MHCLRGTMAAVLAVAGLFFIRCGYLDSAVNSPQAGSTTLSGRVVDSLSGAGLSGVTLTLSGLHDTVVISGENGLFQFSQATTGLKRFSAEINGYSLKALQIDLIKEPNRLDTLRLVRANRPPRILPSLSAYPPPGLLDAPRNLRALLSIYDDDVELPLSRESLTYRFYRGTERNLLALIDSGSLDLSGLPLDSTLLPFREGRRVTLPSKPEGSALAPSTRYFWRFVIRDILGDSAVYGIDSFITRGLFNPADSCPLGMRPVEVESLLFCMDRYEFSNSDLALVDTSFHIPFDLTDFSPSALSPAIEISKTRADTLCRRVGKKLCTISQWRAAAGGYERSPYPYGDTYDSTKCNTNVSYEAIALRQPTATSQTDKPGCVSAFGIYDLSGNVAEWVENDLSLVDPVRYPYMKPEFGVYYPYFYFAGGSWFSKGDSHLSSIRKNLLASLEDSIVRIDVGFRCCLNLK